MDNVEINLSVFLVKHHTMKIYEKLEV